MYEVIPHSACGIDYVTTLREAKVWIGRTECIKCYIWAKV